MIKTRRNAIATHLTMDSADMDHYRYHYGHTSHAVWAFDDCYYCVTKGSQKPATHTSGLEWNWKEVKDNFVNQYGWKIWRAAVEKE